MSSPDATLPVSRRVADLLDRMTLDEKLAQLTSQWMRDLLDDNCVVSSRKMQALLPLGIGQITRAGGSTIFDPVASARATNSVQRYLINETRLGIPAIIHEECCSGYMALAARPSRR